MSLFIVQEIKEKEKKRKIKLRKIGKEREKNQGFKYTATIC